MTNEATKLFLKELASYLKDNTLVSFKFNPKDNDGSRTFSGKLERK